VPKDPKTESTPAASGAPGPAAQPAANPTLLEISQQQQEVLVQAALRGNCPRFYSNGFVVAQTASDISAVLMVNGGVVGVLSMSHISAKSLATALTQSIKNFEESTGQKVTTIEETQELMSKHMGTSHA
jgi:hypothetical protein